MLKKNINELQIFLVIATERNFIKVAGVLHSQIATFSIPAANKSFRFPATSLIGTIRWIRY